MAIYTPGKRDRHNRRRSSNRRNPVAVLSLTAMVDMFTVLLVFLLQNYKEQNVYLKFYKDVALPEASQIKELAPSHVITISKTEIRLDEMAVATYQEVAANPGPMINKLYQPLSKMIAEEMQPQKSFRGSIRDLVRGGNSQQVDKKAGKITIQADKGLDFGTVKKVMYTITEAGGIEMNFAVIRVNDQLAPKKVN